MMTPRDDLRDDDLALSREEEAIAADLRAAFLVAPDPAVAERHIAAMVAAREAVGAPSVISLAGHRSRRALAAAGVVGAVVLGTTGLAAASGSLPGPVQRMVASVGRPIGIDLPSPSTTAPHHDQGDDGSDSDSSTPPSTEHAPPSSVPPSSVPGQGDQNRADPGRGVEPTKPSPNANPHAQPGTPNDTKPPKTGSDNGGDGGSGNGGGSDNGGSGGSGNGGGKGGSGESSGSGGGGA